MPIWVLIMALALLTTALVLAIIIFAVASLRKGGILGIVAGGLALFGGLSLWAFFKPAQFPMFANLAKGGQDAS